MFMSQRLRPTLVTRLFSESSESDSDFKPRYKNLVHEERKDFFRKIDLPENGEMFVVEKLRQEIQENPVVVFMKGEFERPACGYSNLVVQILKFYNVKSGAFLNVLEDNDVRTHGESFSF